MQVRQTALQGEAAARLVLVFPEQGSQRGMQLAQQRVALRLQGPLQLQQRGHHGLRQVLLHHAAHQLPLGCVRHGACSDCLFIIVSSLPGRHLHSTACRIREPAYALSHVEISCRRVRHHNHNAWHCHVSALKLFQASNSIICGSEDVSQKEQSLPAAAL